VKRFLSTGAAVVCLSFVGLWGCGSDDSGKANSNPGAAGSGTTPSGGSSTGPSPTCKASVDTETACADGKDDDCDGFVDCLDSDCETKSCGDGVSCLAGACLGKGALPELPRIDNLVPIVRGDTAIINFSGVVGAADYRIYPLPADDDVLVGPNGEVAIRDAIYRCGGAVPRLNRASDGINRVAVSLAANVQGFTRTEDMSVLGHVYLTPGPGRTPIYRVANPNSIGGYAWEYAAPPAQEFNGAEYVAGTDARDELLAKGWRDDGLAFYAPEDGTVALYRSEYDDGTVLFYADGPEKAAREGDGSQGGERFKILGSAADGTVPLYRIFYSYNNDHDNLAAGEVNRERVLNQGNFPITSLTWPGLKGSTTLVIEALDQGCPFPGGYIAAMDAPATDLDGVPSQPTFTLDEARLTSGEVFINGQYDPANRPKPIARGYVTVEPAPQPEMDWFESFDDSTASDALQKVVEDNIGTRVFRSDKMSLEMVATNAGYSYGAVLGQLLVGSPASYNVAPIGAQSVIAADKFVHATMSVELPSTNRRYPQIWITDTPLGDVDTEISYKVPFVERLGPRPSEMLPPGPYHTIVAQTFGVGPELQIQFCDLRGWGVSQQCPKANIYGFPAGDSKAKDAPPWLPLPVAGEYSGIDRPVKFDVYASTKRVYMFVEDKPAGCAVLPEGRMPAGPVNVIFGVAAYHMEIDEFVVPETSSHQFWRRYSLAHTERKLDDLGVKSGVDLPAWNETIMPCGTQYYAGLL